MVQYAKLWVDRTGSEDAYAWLCESYRVQRDFESAFAINRRILELFSSSPVFARCSGDNYLFMDQYGKAEAEYKKLIDESRPHSHRRMGYRLLSLVYAYEGRYREAERMVDQEIEVASKQGDKLAISDAYLEKAYLLAAGDGDGDAARRAISKQFEFRAADNFGYHVLFNTFLLLGEYQKAAPIVKSQLLAVGPFGDQVVNGYVHRARGEYDAAIKVFETVVARGFVTDKIMRGYELAECYFETGQIEKAIEVLRRTQKLFSQGPPLYRAAVYPRSFYLLGKIFEKKGDHKLAIASFEKFLSLWKKADKDLAELVDAKLRLAKLKVAA
jgi:tetratricopeptide (TPR) repeat protein